METERRHSASGGRVERDARDGGHARLRARAEAPRRRWRSCGGVRRQVARGGGGDRRSDSKPEDSGESGRLPEDLPEAVASRPKTRTHPNGIRRKRRAARRRRGGRRSIPGRRRIGADTNRHEPRRVRSTGSNGSTRRRERCPPRWRPFRSPPRIDAGTRRTRGCRRGSGRGCRRRAGGMHDDASLSATRVDAGTPAPIDTAGKAKKKKKTMKKKKASSPQPRQRRSSPSPSPSPSGSSGPKKLKNLEKALRALKARPRVAKKRAERKRARRRRLFATSRRDRLPSRRSPRIAPRSAERRPILYPGRTVYHPRARARRWTRGRRRRWRG